VGNSGSGKSTLARALADRLGVPYLELDSIFHQADWVPLDPAEFRSRVQVFVAQEAWVVDGNYSSVRPDVWARADTVVWLDLPRSVVMRQLIARTFARMITRRELWNGNRETARSLLRADDTNIVRWAWINDSAYRDRYEAATVDPALARINFIRITRRTGTTQLLDQFGRT
jgi:adenylate kinase family enzyme